MSPYLNGTDSDYSDEDAIFDCYSRADSMSRPMRTLIDCYKRYEHDDFIADRISEDDEAVNWDGKFRKSLGSTLTRGAKKIKGRVWGL